jgi:hypothetical protein
MPAPAPQMMTELLHEHGARILELVDKLLSASSPAAAWTCQPEGGGAMCTTIVQRLLPWTNLTVELPWPPSQMQP